MRLFHVMKFGGSSVATLEQIHKVFEIVKKKPNAFVVSSAHKGVTDLLIQCAMKAADTGIADASAVIERQMSVAQAVHQPVPGLEALLDEFKNLLVGISLVREVSPRSLDYVQSFGERLSVRTMATYFRTQGMNAEAFDAFDLGFITNAEFGRARPLLNTYDEIRKKVESKIAEGVTPIVTGFIGKTIEGAITTVGRNGSDYSASVFAAALHSPVCEIWTDTDGVMTADPSLVKSAQSIPQMSFSEASELARFGARVLHPATLIPAIEAKVPVRVLNTNRPEHPGTEITESGTNFGTESSNKPRGSEFCSIAYKEKQWAVHVSSVEMLEQPGFLARVFEVFARFGVDVDLVATSEVSVSVTVSKNTKLEQVVSELSKFCRVNVQPGKTVVCVVGHDLKQSSGVAARVFESLSKQKVSAELISFGASHHNLSFVVDDSVISTTITTLHSALFER